MQVRSADGDKNSRNMSFIWEILLKEKSERKVFKEIHFSVLAEMWWEKLLYYNCVSEGELLSCGISWPWRFVRFAFSTVFHFCKNIHAYKFTNSGGLCLTLLMHKQQAPSQNSVGGDFTNFMLLVSYCRKWM